MSTSSPTQEKKVPEKRVPKFPVQVSGHVELAFELNGVAYWNFTDFFNSPSERGLESLTYYEEFQKRTTRQTYQDELDSEIILLRDIRLSLSGQQGRINLAAAFEKLADLEKILKYREERLKFIIEPDLVWKLASVVYFDETENPNRYDMKYNIDTKIPFWKKHVKEEDFFLSMPIIQLIPHLEEYAPNLTTLSKVTRMMREVHLNHLSSIKSNLF